MKIIESINMVEQFRKPKSKKKRMIKKWVKQVKNWRPIINSVYLADGTIICHPAIAHVILQSIEQTEKTFFDGLNRAKLDGLYYE